MLEFDLEEYHIETTENKIIVADFLNFCAHKPRLLDIEKIETSSDYQHLESGSDVKSFILLDKKDIYETIIRQKFENHEDEMFGAPPVAPNVDEKINKNQRSEKAFDFSNFKSRIDEHNYKLTTVPHLMINSPILKLEAVTIDLLMKLVPDKSKVKIFLFNSWEINQLSDISHKFIINELNL